MDPCLVVVLSELFGELGEAAVAKLRHLQLHHVREQLIPRTDADPETGGEIFLAERLAKLSTTKLCGVAKVTLNFCGTFRKFHFSRVASGTICGRS